MRSKRNVKVSWTHLSSSCLVIPPRKTSPLSWPGTYPFSAHTPSPKAIVPIHIHPVPKPMTFSVPSFVFSQWLGLLWWWISIFMQSYQGNFSNIPTSKKLKKIRSSKLCSLCSKRPMVNENLNQNELRRPQALCKPLTFQVDYQAPSDFKTRLEASETFRGLTTRKQGTI